MTTPPPIVSPAPVQLLRIPYKTGGELVVPLSRLREGVVLAARHTCEPEPDTDKRRLCESMIVAALLAWLHGY